jgi:thioredoxin reductase (NADPH)
MIHRRDSLRACKAMQHKVSNTPNIEMIWNSVPEEVLGDSSGVNGLRVKNIQTGESRNLDITGFFVAIGHSPNSEIFRGQLKMNDLGYIETVPGSTRTSVDGVFACGDVQDYYYRQAVTAAGTGCMAAIEAERFLSTR